jgi:hypothetical protein
MQPASLPFKHIDGPLWKVKENSLQEKRRMKLASLPVTFSSVDAQRRFETL